MLPRPWIVRGVDIEPLCKGVLVEMARRSSMKLEPADHDESLAFLLGEVVVLDRKYDAGRAGIVFAPWLYQRLRWAIVDHWRSFYGRQGQHRLPDSSAEAHWEHDHGELRRDRLEQIVGEVAGDRGDHGASDLCRVLSRRHREVDEAKRAMGLAVPRGAKGRDPRPARAAGA